MTCSTYGNGRVTETEQWETNDCCLSVVAELCYSKLYVDCVLSTRQEMSRVRKAVDAHVEDFIVNDELLLPILKKQSYSAHAHYTLLEMLHPACLSYQYGSAVPAPTITNPLPTRRGSSRGLWSVLATVRVSFNNSDSLWTQVSYSPGRRCAYTWTSWQTHPSPYHLTQAVHPTSHLLRLP